MESLNLIYTELEKHDEPIINKIPLDTITSLIDNDLILTIKDRIQTPIYDETPIDDVVNWLENNGFVDIERLTRYPKFNNIRQFLSPLYHNYESDLSKILFNEGYLHMKALKNSIPKHLKKYVVSQDYSSYSYIDHSCWKFIMKISGRTKT